VPLIMYAIIARVPINTMFLAGLLPALVMVSFPAAGRRLSEFKDWRCGQRAAKAHDFSAGAGAWRQVGNPGAGGGHRLAGWRHRHADRKRRADGLAYALLTQSMAHRELDWPLLRRSLVECAEVIGGIMVILGMALGLTNFLIDAGIPDRPSNGCNRSCPTSWPF
jgi:C4-dicarboxylate transporter DctM subunit